MNETSEFNVDVPLLGALLLLCAGSLAILYSAGGEDLGLLGRQSVRIGAALAVMLVLAQIAPASLARWSPYVFGAGLVLLLLVLGIGIVGKGAQRWLDLGILRFQPAEIMKLAVPMMVAWILTRTPLPPRIRDLAVAMAVVLVPVALVVLQPDLGTAVLIGVSGVLVIFLAGLRWRYILSVVLLVAATTPVLWSMLHDYQRRRIVTLFDPWADPLGAGYHTIQSIIAVGSGGTYGKGWLNGSQSQLEFIPERSTDFIYAVFAEEFGLIGGLTLVALYMFIIARSLMISFYARDTYSRLLSGSLALTFFFYLFVNIGMVAGILPVVGVPLPLVSYGGTSMVTLMAGFGILMSIQSHRPLMQ
ncbi:MAG: rod shape-determining protein RodA [Gammaproteobacteria bacterium]|nr:rod shape-determining protein RodA [Gammaproteobacteria bacterium]MDH3465281.1 rod shape-determining protein RodA [Gammaproteobacteria bacterium]